MWKLGDPTINGGGSGPNSEPWIASVRVLPTLEPNSFIVVTSRPSPLNQANFFNCAVSAEQPVRAAEQHHLFSHWKTTS